MNPELELVSTEEATEIMGVAHNTVRAHAKRMGWDVFKKPRNGPPTFMYRRSDVESYQQGDGYAARETLDIEALCKTTEALVEWADALTEWPTDEEINSKITERYQFKDIVGLIEARRFRRRKKDKHVVLLAKPDGYDEQHELIYKRGALWLK